MKQGEFLFLASAVLLPLCGVLLAGNRITMYLEFPPLTRYVEHADFSWFAFIVMAIFLLSLTAPLITRVLCSRADTDDLQSRPFPEWGWAALCLCVASWVLAWTRFDWFSDFQIFTFSPLWLGYIGVVNALTYARSGSCMLLHRPKYLALLFIASAFFWWYFEYLNRFVQNWYYSGIQDLSPVLYALFATLPFSTVLPAVLSTYELLATIPKLQAGLKTYTVIDNQYPRLTALIILATAAFGLLGIGIYPDYLYPLLWLSPLFILTGIQRLGGRQTIFSALRQGDWRRIFLLAVSALVCGFFWEMWNYFSAAKWLYSIPFVEKFHIFEMPLLGYAGYLPFGLECGVIADYCEIKSEPGLNS